LKQLAFKLSEFMSKVYAMA